MRVEILCIFIDRFCQAAGVSLRIAESDELSRNYPIQISIFHFFVMLIVFYIEIVKVEKIAVDCLKEGEKIGDKWC